MCPRCFFSNAWEAEECQRVVGRSKAMADQLPLAWVYMHEAAPVPGTRGRAGAAEILRCLQPKPATLYQPTIVSLQVSSSSGSQGGRDGTADTHTDGLPQARRRPPPTIATAAGTEETSDSRQGLRVCLTD